MDFRIPERPERLLDEIVSRYRDPRGYGIRVVAFYQPICSLSDVWHTVVEGPFREGSRSTPPRWTVVTSDMSVRVDPERAGDDLISEIFREARDRGLDRPIFRLSRVVSGKRRAMR